MKSELSSLEVRVIVKELSLLVGARVDQVYQLKDKDVVIQLHKSGSGKQKVRIWAPKAVFLSLESYEFPQNPHTFCTSLRKYLSLTKLSSVTQFGAERVIILEFASKEASCKIIVELFSKGNIILCDGDMKIISVSERQIWSARKLNPGEQYVFPPARMDFFSATDQNLLSAALASNKDALVKFLAMDIGLGGTYAEEICFQLGLDKLSPTKNIDGELALKIIASIHKIDKAKLNSLIVYKNSEVENVIPWPLKIYEGLESKSFSSYSAALDNYYATEHKEPSANEKKIESLNRILQEQEDMLIIINREIDENAQKGDFIYSNYQQISEILSTFSEARKKHSWKEIKSRVKDHPVVKEVDEKTAKIVIEL